MSLNWKEIDTILTELPLEGSRIQKIKQPDFRSVVFELYHPERRFVLFVSLGQGETRLHSLSRPVQNPDVQQRFSQFLRSRVGGGRIAKAYQVGDDRIVHLNIHRAGEETNLWIRLWGGAANIIATDGSDMILDAFYRRPARGETSGGVYNPEKERLPEKKRSPESYQVREIAGEGSFNDRIEKFYFDMVRSRETQQRYDRLLREIDEETSKLESATDRLRRESAEAVSPDEFRHVGDLILSNIHRIRPGDSWVTVEDYEQENRQKAIQLDPNVSPEQNAEAQYDRYKKAKRRMERLEAEIARNEKSLARLVRKKESVLAQQAAELEASDTGATPGGPSQRKTTTRGERRAVSGGTGRRGAAGLHGKAPGLRFRSGTFTILVGRTARENEELLRRWVAGNDYWLHARDYPGAYVFIKHVPGKSVPLDVLLDAGNLAVNFSKAKAGGQADLYYTQVKYLRRPREGKPGLVLPTHEKNLVVRLDEERLARLRDRDDKSET